MALRRAAGIAAPVLAVLACAAPAAQAVTQASVTIVAGGGSILAPNVPTSSPFALATDVQLGGAVPEDAGAGELLLTDGPNARVYEAIPGGDIIPKLGTGVPAGSAGICPSDGTGQFHGPRDTILYNKPAVGQVYVVSDRDELCQVNVSTGAGTILSGGGAGYADGSVDAQYHTPADLEPFSGATTGFYVADVSNKAVRKYVDPNVTTVAGGPANTTPPAEPPDPPSSATAVDIGSPDSISAIDDSTFYVANFDEVFKVSAGTIRRVAGLGADITPSDGDDATADAFSVGSVQALHDGGFLFTDVSSGHLWRVSPGGQLGTLIAGQYGGVLFLTNSALYIGDQIYVKRIPATEIIGGPSGFTSSTSASFQLASWDEQATYECRLDTAPAWGVCGDYTGLTEGKHTFHVRATTDGATRVDGDVSRIWKVDLTAPSEFALGDPAPDAALTDAKPVFSWSPTSDPNGLLASGVDHYELWVDHAFAASVAPAACAAACSASAPSALADGAHTWEVHAIDKVGNTRTVGARSFTVAAPPSAALSVAPSRALIGRAVTFDAGTSSDPNGSIVKYEWDLNGDGNYELDTGASSTTSKVYSTPVTLQAGVRVTDSGGLTAEAHAPLVVSAQAPVGRQLGVSINDGAQYTNDPNVTVFAVWPSFASDALVSNDGGFKLAQSFPVAEKIPWKLDSSGPERLPKTIYVRFLGGIQTSETYQDDIILDQTPPKVDQAAVAPAAGAATARAARTLAWRVKLKATDSNSGVGTVQVTANKRKPGKLIRYKKKLTVRSAKRPAFVRARDRAGNFSPWRKAKR